MTKVRNRAPIAVHVPGEPRAALRIVGALTALWVAALAGACGSDETSGSASSNQTACDPATQVCATGATVGSGGVVGAGGAAGAGADPGSAAASSGGSSGVAGSTAGGGAAGTATDAGSGGATQADGGDAADSSGGGSDAGGGGGGTTAPPADGLLAQCATDADCTGSLVCYDPDSDGVGGYCTESCADGGACPDLDGVASTCSPVGGECRVDCSPTDAGPGACPALMQCSEVSVGQFTFYRCEYPPEATGGGGTDAGADAGGGGGGGGGALPGELAACTATADCGTDLSCYGGNFAPTGTSGFCSRSCNTDSDCYDHDGVDATCGNGGLCSIDCGTNGTDGACPSGMACAQLFGNTMRCFLVAI